MLINKNGNSRIIINLGYGLPEKESKRILRSFNTILLKYNFNLVNDFNTGNSRNLIFAKEIKLKP